MMFDVQKTVPWEVMIYADYIAQDNSRLFSAKEVKKHGSKSLPIALINGAPYMANKKAKQNGQPNFTPVKWVNRTLTDDDVTTIEQWNVDKAEILASLILLVDTGHTITLKLTSDGDGFMCSAVGNGDDCVNKGLGLSAYASEPESACKVLVYKHFGIFEGVWPKQDDSQKPKYR